MRSLSAVLVVVAALAAAGCEGIGSRKTSDDRLATTPRRVIPDVPVPDGFRMDLDHTFYNSSGTIRSGYATYTGRAKMPMLVEFYKDNMPISGWALTNESGSGGSYILNYEKTAEQVAVKITPGTFYTTIVVSFLPRTAPRK